MTGEPHLYSILLIEADRAEQLAVARVIADLDLPYDLTAAADWREAHGCLAQHRFDLVLARVDVSSAARTEIARLARAVPLVVVIGSSSETAAIEMLKAGAYQYVVKDQQRHYLRVLPTIIDNAVRRRRVEIAMEEQRDKQIASDERQRLARELFDSLSQTLFSLNALSEALVVRYQQRPEAMAVSLHDLALLSRAAMSEMQVVVIELYPNAITEAPIDRLIRQLIDAKLRHTEVVFQTQLPTLLRLPDAVQIAVYRVVQEAIDNLIWHSGARQAWVTFSGGADGFTVRIRDDGQGMDLVNLPTGSSGLLMMVRRAKMIGGELRISSKPGQGTEIILTWQDTG